MKKISRAFAVTSIALAALAYFSLKRLSYFRWPVAIIAASSSVFFLFLHLVLSYPTLIFRGETRSGPQKIEENSTPDKGRSSSPPQIERRVPLPGAENGSLQRAHAILETHGIYFFKPKEISACIQTEDLQKRLLDNKEDPNELCVEIEKQLCMQAKKNLERKWGEYYADDAMQWVEILANLNQKPNPYQAGEKALALADKAPLMLACYGNYRLSIQSKELFPTINFLAWQSTNQSLPPPEDWRPEFKQKFFTVLGEMIQKQYHTLIKLDILNTLTAEGYTLTEIKAASVYMKPTGKVNRHLSQSDLLGRSLHVLNIAKRASEALQEHSQTKYPFAEILPAANQLFEARFEHDLKAFSEAVEAKILELRNCR